MQIALEETIRSTSKSAYISSLFLNADEDAQKKALCDGMIPAYQQFRSWAEEFDNASLEVKKMIACQLFNRVEIGKGYQIHIELNMTYRQFLEDWNGDKWITAIA